MRVKKLPSRLPKRETGGMIEGPPHEQGGVPVVDQNTGEPMVEAEGGERIFSVEDTQQMEEIGRQIIELQQNNPTAADQLAKELGYMVVEMIVRQEQNTAMTDEAANSFANSPEDY
jgi:hypothetical protein